MNLDIRKVDTIIQKINYLFKSIKKNQDKNLSAEQMLLKKYATDLMDSLLESEMRLDTYDPDLLKPPVLSEDINDTGLIAVQNLKQAKEEKLPEPRVVDFDDKFSAENPFAEQPLNSDFNPFAEKQEEEPALKLSEDLSENTLSDYNATEVIESDALRYMPNEEPQIISEEEEEEEDDLLDELFNDEVSDFDEDDSNVRTEVLGSLSSLIPNETKKDEASEKPDKKELNDILAGAQKKELSLADKLRQNLAADKFDISDAQRYAFINELFAGDTNAYEQTLLELNKKTTVIDAFSYINLHVKMKYNWKDDSTTTRSFQEIVKNRFFRN